VRRLLACAAALATAPVAAASRHVRPARGAGFDEVHLGRRIRGVPPSAATGGRWRVTVDGRPLHLMRRADGTWFSMVDHYCSYPTPLEAARAAVAELGPGERLREDGRTAPAGRTGDTGHRGDTGHTGHSGSRRGVHA
jgi:hypothetical protein